MVLLRSRIQITTLVYRLLELAKNLESRIYVHLNLGIWLFMLYTAILPFIKCAIRLSIIHVGLKNHLN